MWRPRVFADYCVAILAMAWLVGLYDLRANGRVVFLIGAAAITALLCRANTGTLVSITPERVATYSLFVRRGSFAPADVRLELAYGRFASVGRLVACDDGRILAHLGGMLGKRPVERLRRRAVDAGVTVVDAPWRSATRIDRDFAITLFAAVVLVAVVAAT